MTKDPTLVELLKVSDSWKIHQASIDKVIRDYVAGTTNGETAGECLRPYRLAMHTANNIFAAMLEQVRTEKARRKEVKT